MLVLRVQYLPTDARMSGVLGERRRVCVGLAGRGLEVVDPPAQRLLLEAELSGQTGSRPTQPSRGPFAARCTSNDEPKGLLDDVHQNVHPARRCGTVDGPVVDREH